MLVALSTAALLAASPLPLLRAQVLSDATDAGEVDAGAPDAGISDAGAPSPDAGEKAVDAGGPIDAGTQMAPVDAGEVTDAGSPFDFDGGTGDGYTDPDTDTQGVPSYCSTSADCPDLFICFKNECEPEEGGPNPNKGGFGCGCNSAPTYDAFAVLALLAAASRRRRRA